MKDQKKQKQDKKGRKAGMIAFGVTAVLYASLFGLWRISDYLLAAAMSLLVGKVVSVMGSGLDLTTHNKQDEGKKPKEPEELPLSGNDAADGLIEKGQEMLRQIRRENDAIPDQVLSGQMDELERLCIQIFKTVAEKPAKAPKIRKFMDYYLPTTLKMLASYRTMNERGVSVSDMTEARSTLIRGMGMVLTACQKQLDSLYKDDMLDVSTDIDVLEQMLKRDGFTEGELGSIRETPAAAPAQAAQAPTLEVPGTAAAAQMKRSEPKQLQGETNGGKEDFVSFYDQKRGS